MNAAGVEFMCAESFSHRTRSAEWFALPLFKVLAVHLMMAAGDSLGEVRIAAVVLMIRGLAAVLI
jgi:hypothetical protein